MQVHTLGGRYQLEQCIGVGGMSEVWRGYDRVLARPVAVKVLTAEQAADRTSDERVRTEARSAAKLSHPNVAGVYDFGTSPFVSDTPAPYIVMELVEGATLADHLEAGPMDWHIGVRICAEVSAALAAAHQHGIVHRDVKPANVMLTPSGAKVLDFGIATGTGQPDWQPDGTVLGTPAYLAPERIDGAPATPAADMYALGVLLYQCLTGRLPWPADTGAELLRAHRDDPPEPLPVIDGLAAEVSDLCHRCLDKHPAERPSSLVAALILAEAVDARVYVPSMDLVSAPGRTGARQPGLTGTRQPGVTGARQPGRQPDGSELPGPATVAASAIDLPTGRFAGPGHLAEGGPGTSAGRPGGHVGRHRAPPDA